MIKWIPKGLIITLLLYGLALIGSLYLTYAYYQKDKLIPIELLSGDVEVDMIVTFNDEEIDPFSSYYDMETHILKVHVSDDSSLNAISKLKIQLVVRSEYAIRLRIKLMESYIKERFYLQTEDTLQEIVAIKENREGYHPYSNLIKGSTYISKLGEDGYQYYPSIIEENETVTIDLIDGGLLTYARVNEQFIENIYLDLSLMVEVVQANRYQELWGLPIDFFEEE